MLFRMTPYRREVLPVMKLICFIQFYLLSKCVLRNVLGLVSEVLIFNFDFDFFTTDFLRMNII